MGWGFSDIGDMFDSAGKLFLAGATGGASLLAEAADPGSPGSVPANPANSEAAAKERDKKAREEVIRRALGGLESNIATSPLGLTDTAAVSAKSLLGS